MLRVQSSFDLKTKNQIQSATPISDEDLFKYCPSIFATQAWDGCSERYAFIPTSRIIHELRKEGFQPFSAIQANSRTEGKAEFTRHMLRFRHESEISSTEAKEIIYTNAHDKTSASLMVGGVLRFVCNNGCVAGENIQEIRIRHNGNVIDNVIEGSYRILKDFELIDSSMDIMKSIKLETSEQRVFAEAALSLKYDEPDKAPIHSHQLLDVKRRVDLKGDLWTIFNVVQENLIRGGLAGRTANNRRTTTRAVNSISENIKLNRALWTLAESMAALKS